MPGGAHERSDGGHTEREESRKSLASSTLTHTDPVPITIKVDISKAVAEVKLAHRQIPFIAAKTLTDTAKGAQKETITSLTSRSRFTLRNTWTSSSIRIKPATKTELQADVHSDFSRRPGATDYLAMQEDNYVKVSSHTYLCIPTDALYALCGGRSRLIPDSLKPAALLNYCDKEFQYNITKGKHKGQVRTVGNGPAVRGFVFFNSTHTSGGGRKYLTTKSGARGIWGRRANSQQAYLLYVMVRNTKSVRRRFYMEEVVREAVDANWRQNWDKNWADAFAKGVRI